MWIRTRQNPIATGVLIGMILAGLAGVSAFGWQFRKTVAARDEAQSNYLAAQAQSIEETLRTR